MNLCLSFFKKIIHKIVFFRENKSLLECVTTGAKASSRLVIDIAVNLVVYVALLYLVNHILTFSGQLVGIEDFTFNVNYFYTCLKFEKRNFIKTY